MSNIEKRNIRIEDWEGNIYYPETQSGGPVMGRAIYSKDAKELPPRDPSSRDTEVYTNGSIVDDDKSNFGKAIYYILRREDEQLHSILVAQIAGVPFGKLAVNARMKLDWIGDPSYLTDPMVSFYFCQYDPETRREDIIVDYTIPYEDVVKNKYVDYGFIVDYSGTYIKNSKLKVYMDAYMINPIDANIVYLDNLTISKAMPSL